MNQIKLNGNEITTEHTTILALLDDLGLTEGRFAVEVDGELIPKSQLSQSLIKQGMIIEVVQAVGGG